MQIKLVLSEDKKQVLGYDMLPTTNVDQDTIKAIRDAIFFGMDGSYLTYAGREMKPKKTEDVLKLKWRRRDSQENYAQDLEDSQKREHAAKIKRDGEIALLEEAKKALDDAQAKVDKVNEASARQSQYDFEKGQQDKHLNSWHKRILRCCASVSIAAVLTMFCSNQGHDVAATILGVVGIGGIIRIAYLLNNK